MLRTLAFGAIAAIAGRQLYKSGALQRFSDDARRRLNDSGLARGRDNAYAATGTSGTAI